MSQQRTKRRFSTEFRLEAVEQAGYRVGRWLALRLMQECGLKSRQPGRHRYWCQTEEGDASENLLKRQFMPAEPEQVWCDDISYIRRQGGWCYLALVVDLYSQRVVGSAMSLSPDTMLVSSAMRNALEKRQRKSRLLFHSDQGSQYKSKKYRQLLWKNSVIQSISCRGNRLDNSPVRNLRSEWLPPGGYSDMVHAIRDVEEWIAYWYNRKRPHSHHGGLSPCEYERLWKQEIKVSRFCEPLHLTGCLMTTDLLL